ncbi:uncharacterized protein LOC125947712 [Dermacentor silvarum]|uniref:uncharacterized protein LOC125947712 n=1 Tax=Dermacentor silvarum TaxID=543639 RepID=UPI002101C681|nr:uncharacterized protein LOC125947712 [Dermacentor silvarum]
MEEMVVDPSSGRDRPPVARKRLSSSVESEAADSESDARSDDSDAFIPAKHRRSRRKSSTSSSSEATIIYSSIVTTTVAFVPVDVMVSLNAISKQKLHDFFFKLAPGLIQEVRVNPRKNIIAVDTTDEKTVQTLLGLSQLCGVNTRAYIPQGADVTAGVISDVDLELQDDVLKSMIVCTPPCKIISVRRLGSSKCVKLLFDCAKLPSHIKAGLVRYPVRPFVPRPLQCRKCLKLGHVQGFCTSAVVCAKCGQNHDANSCDSPTSRCPNCNGEHLATDKECPTLKKKLKFLKKKAKKKASGEKPSSRSARPAATNGKTEDIPAPTLLAASRDTNPALFGANPPPHKKIAMCGSTAGGRTCAFSRQECSIVM